MKIEKYTLAQGVILFAMLMEAHFFYIVKLPSIFWYGHNPDNKSYIFIVMYLFLFIYLIQHGFRLKGKNELLFTIKFMVPYCIISAFLIIRSMLLYDQSLFDMTQCADFLFAPPLVFVFILAFNQRNGFEKTVEMIVNIVFIIQIVIFAQSVIYRFTGLQICYGMRQTGLLQFRNGEMRSPRFPLNFLGIAYAFNQLIFEKRKKSKRGKNIIFILISLYNIAFCLGYRTLSIAFIAMLAVIIMFSKEIGTIKKVLFVFGGIIIAFANDIIGTLADFLSISGSYHNSNVVRFSSFKFFWNRFIQHPLFGFGMIRPTNSVTSELSGVSSRNYVTDAALIGNLSEIGIIGISLFLVLFFRGVYIAFKVKHNKYQPLLFGLLTYVVISSLGLSIIAIPRCLAIPVLMAFFEYIYFDYKRGINNEN